MKVCDTVCFEMSGVKCVMIVCVHEPGTSGK